MTFSFFRSKEIEKEEKEKIGEPHLTKRGERKQSSNHTLVVYRVTDDLGHSDPVSQISLVRLARLVRLVRLEVLVGL